MNILVVAAHPDDEALGCGGTIARHAASGDIVDILFVADGETSRETANAEAVATRRNQATAAAAILGARTPRFLDLPDNQLDTLPLLTIIRKLEAAISDLQPDLIYTHHAGDLNLDHQIVCRATLTLCRPLPETSVSEIRGFEVLSSTNWNDPDASFKPVCFVNIASTLERKLLALKCYAREMREFPHARSFAAIEALAKVRGAVAGLSAAEAFSVYRRIERD